jgi:hypothetical protein
LAEPCVPPAPGHESTGTANTNPLLASSSAIPPLEPTCHKEWLSAPGRWLSRRVSYLDGLAHRLIWTFFRVQWIREEERQARSKLLVESYAGAEMPNDKVSSGDEPR